MSKNKSKRPSREYTWNAQAVKEGLKQTLESEKQNQQLSIPTDTEKKCYSPLSHISNLAKFNDTLKKLSGAPIHELIMCVATQDKAWAEKIEKYKDYPTDIHCKLNKSDVERMRPTLCKYVFNGTPSTDEILGALSCKAEKPLSVKDVRYLAFFLENLNEKGIICQWWQKAYIEAKAFSWKGKPIEKFSNRLQYAKDDFSSLKTLPNKLKTNQAKRLQDYQELEML